MEKLYNFYGMSSAVLLQAPVKAIQEVLDKLSNSFSSHMLNSLYFEARLLKHILYEKDQFRYALDEESPKVAAILKYADFSVVYRRYLNRPHNEADELPADLQGDISPAGDLQDLSDIAGIDGLESDLDSEATSLFSGDSLDELMGSESAGGGSAEGANSMADTGLEELASSDGGLDDLMGSPTDGLDDLLGESKGESESTSLLEDLTAQSEFDGLEAFADMDADLNGELGSDGDDLLGSADTMGIADLMDGDLTGGSEANNQRLLQTLEYDTEFYRIFESGDFSGVLKYIQDWKLTEILNVHDLRKYIASARRFTDSNSAALREELASLDERYVAIKELLQTAQDSEKSLIMTRLERNTSRREAVAKELEDNDTFSLYFSKEFAKVIEGMLDSCPKMLLKECSLNGSRYVMTDLEYAFVKIYHTRCSELVEGSQTRIDYLIEALLRTRNKNTVNTQQFLNTPHNMLMSKRSPAQLLLFNFKFKKHLDLYKNIMAQMCEQYINDCDILLADAESAETNLRSFLTVSRRTPGIQGEVYISPIPLAQAGATAHKLIQSGYADKFGFSVLSLSEERLTSFLQVLISHNSVMSVIVSDDVVYTLYKIWQLICEFTPQSLAQVAGLQDIAKDDSEFKDGVISVEWLKSFYIKFGLPGLYIDPVGKFIRCLRIGSVLVNSSTTSISREERDAVLRHNVEVLRDYMKSKLRSEREEFPVISFRGD